jgi:hypothetical protein
LWSAGLDKLLARLTTIGEAVAVIGDGPVTRSAGLFPPACIAKEVDFRTCRVERRIAAPPAVLDLERSIAAAHGAAFLDITPWLCDKESCPVVIDHNIVYADGQGHLTTAFTLSLGDRLLAALPFPGSG